MDARLTHLSCPTDIVDAPIETVWSLVTDFARWGDFYDIRVEKVEPPGLARPGQRMTGNAGSRFLPMRVTFECTEVDPARHNLKLFGWMPFGIEVRENMTMLRIDDTHCRVNYNCDFALPEGLRGKVLSFLLRRQFATGPADSLARLKRAAERAYSETPQHAGIRHRRQ